MTDWLAYFTASRRNLFKQSLANRRLIELILERTPAGGRVLEAGCGTGLLSIILSTCGFDVVALDREPRLFAYAPEMLGLDSRKVRFVEGDLFALRGQFDAGSFDTACHSGVLEHFSDDQIVAGLAEQRAVARRVIFRIPNGRNRMTSQSFGDERYLDNGHWVRLIRGSGFSRVQVFGDYDLPRAFYFMLPGFCFHRRFSGWWKWASPHTVFVCE